MRLILTTSRDSLASNPVLRSLWQMKEKAAKAKSAASHAVKKTM